MTGHNPKAFHLILGSSFLWWRTLLALSCKSESTRSSRVSRTLMTGGGKDALLRYRNESLLDLLWNSASLYVHAFCVSAYPCTSKCLIMQILSNRIQCTCANRYGLYLRLRGRESSGQEEVSIG